MAESIVTAAPRPPAERRALEALEFPGCRPVYISRDDIADYEGRIEFWDADTETTMVCEPTGYYHERPLHRLTHLVRCGEQRLASGHVDERLIEAQGLDQAREGAEGFHHHLGDRVVALEAGREHDRVERAYGN